MKDYSVWLKAWETYEGMDDQIQKMVRYTPAMVSREHFWGWVFLGAGIALLIIAFILFFVSKPPALIALMLGVALVVSGPVGIKASTASTYATWVDNPAKTAAKPLTFDRQVMRETGVTGLVCTVERLSTDSHGLYFRSGSVERDDRDVNLKLRSLPDGSSYDCRYVDAHGDLHTDGRLLIDHDSDKAGLYDGAGRPVG